MRKTLFVLLLLVFTYLGTKSMQKVTKSFVSDVVEYRQENAGHDPKAIKKLAQNMKHIESFLAH